MGDHHVGVLDTSTYIDLDFLDHEALPEIFELTTITFAELHHGVAVAMDAAAHDVRTKRLGAAMVDYDPLPFDRRASTRYGSLIRLTIEAGRDPRSRRLDLMIAAIASSNHLPLYTRNPKDFVGLESLVEVVEV
ncbi:type II toxin-antitoxin system VapC family toxin [Saccharothrix sp. S26]|uniref:type II toxin-antitoxin system VapC family toxin n=1 Tax=Saccharothrix sp. S26 TaxID=2907215 RepID=UPI001F1D2EC3|nr:type II toxin-antitoxin system VapC family toxin [Saccharothrix sp. S26]MCE6999525.1 type II toxin-antitoxin system VapC family toxin [Saccharothrix sp. S26]